MAAGTSEAWDKLMAAPWGRFSEKAKQQKAEALAEYQRDWDRHPANPKNKGEA